ncbi:MAG: ATP-dependent DNA helicase RecG [Candidatus Nomurabacteria bacterium]|nr:ATP-dependent DNA helicase RecG [Candidatus Nomurabacteria bacterium]
MNIGDKLEDISRLDINQKKALHKLGLFSVADLLFYFPVRYSDISQIKQIDELIAGETATVYGKVTNLKTKKGFRSHIPMGEAYIEDLSGRIKIIWFHQAYLAKMIHEGENIKLTGKVTESKSGLYLTNPEFEKIGNLPIDKHESLFKNSPPRPLGTPPYKGGENNTGLSYPVYRETRGITSKWIYHTIQKIFNSSVLDGFFDYIPKDILDKYHLPSLKTSLIWIHTPQNEHDSLSARKRFAFEEVFFIQLQRQQDRREYKNNKSFRVNPDETKVQEFLERFPFEATQGQVDAINTILTDIKADHPMSRLLEGDVGSGKTAVAATVTYATVTQRPPLPPPRFDSKTPLLRQEGKDGFGNLQVAYMAPTEILATQHFESFIKYFKHLPINVALLTGKTCRKFPSKVSPDGWTNISRAQLLKWTANGEIPILIGTHALISKSVKFKNLALTIIDEQHRFGTAQRRNLVRKDGFAPHLLSMTATPIPRTLALTIYGDLDLSLLDEMPAGRKPVITEIITPDKREDTYKKIKEEMAKGRQLYVICPRIDEPDPEKELALTMKSAVAEAKRLKKEVFQDCEIDVLHSKMTKEKKEKVMERFTLGAIDILVATSVIEVGVNVPNATIIIIEGAERFGLAQLHQLRGRVIRSNHQAFCYVFAEAKSEKTMHRLKALKTAKNGFELSELDLSLRGAGELAGSKQWGITDLGMEAIKNIKMVEAARLEATNLITTDPDLRNFPKLKDMLTKKHLQLHFE